MRGHFKGEPVGPGLKEMRSAAKQGECICCGDPAVPLSTDKDSARHRKDPSRTHQDTCGDEACHTARMRLWRRDQRKAMQAVNEAAARLRKAAQSTLRGRQCESGAESEVGHG